MSATAYDLTMPGRRSTGAVFASPHSGRAYPRGFLDATQLCERAIRSSEDAFVDRLWAQAPIFGAPLICARAPRSFIDLNRAPEELDPALVEGVRRVPHNPRIASGLGVIPRVVAGGRPIYSGKIPLAHAQRRIRDWWRPYHEELRRLLQESRDGFGEALLIDCHSMPHEAIEVAGGLKPEIVLGDRFGASARPELVDAIEVAFRDEGFRVARNAPFAGAYIAQTYGRPAHRTSAVQIEIDRSLYMDEARIEPRPEIHEISDRLGRIAERICGLVRPANALAAE